MVKDGAFSHKIDYGTFFPEILNLEGHPNCNTGSRETVILLQGSILAIGGASAVEGLHLTGLPRLVLLYYKYVFKNNLITTFWINKFCQIVS